MEHSTNTSAMEIKKVIVYCNGSDPYMNGGGFNLVKHLNG